MKLEESGFQPDPWHSMSRTIAEGAEDADYVFANYTHMRIAYEYIQEVKSVIDLD